MNVLWDQDQKGRIWHSDEIYFGVAGTENAGLRVPNVGDGVFKNGVVMTVVSVDSETYIPTLEDALAVVNESKSNSLLQILDRGLSVTAKNILTRCYVDTHTEPYTISFDARFRIWDSTATSMKLVLGDGSDPSAPVVSHTLDTNGNILSELVGMKEVNPNGGEGLRPGETYTTTDLKHGDHVTGIFYKANGRVTDEVVFSVVMADLVSGPNLNNVYIQDITLESPLLSATNPLLFENPAGHSFNTSLVKAIVHYNNGMKLDLPVDGNRVILHGIRNFDTSQRGKITDIVASYYPDADEPAINLNGEIKKSISKVYNLINVDVPGEFPLRVYVIPTYQNGGWVLNYRITSLAYDVDIDVTAYATALDGNGRAFNPNNLNVFQRLHLTVDLGAMNSVDYPGYKHVQKLDLKLPDYSTIDTVSWMMDYGCDGITVFGDGTYAKVSQVGDKPFTIKCGQTSLDDWLRVVYYGVDPSFDALTLPKAPTPTHFRLEHAGTNGQGAIGTYSVTEWNSVLYLGPLVTWDAGWPLNLVWLNDDGSRVQTLAVTALPVKFLYV